MARPETPTPAELVPDPSTPAVPWGFRFASALGVLEAGRVLRDFASYLPAQLVPALASFAVLPLLTRKLVPTELGIVTLDQMLMLLAAVVAGSWYTAAIVRELPAAAPEGGYARLRRTLVAGLAISLGVLVLWSALLALVGLSSSAIGANLWLLIAGSFGFFFLNASSSLFQARLRPHAYAAVQLLARVGGMALGIWLVYRGHAVSGYLFGVACVPLVVGAAALGLAWPRSRHDDPAPSHVSGWLRYGLPIAASAVMFWGLSSLDRYLLALLRDTGSAGVYSVGTSLGYQAVNIPLFAFLTGATPLLMTAFERSGRGEVERLMRAYTRVMLLIALPIVGLAAALSDELVALVTGGKEAYVDAGPVIPLVAVAALLTALGSLAGMGLGTARQTRFLVIGSGIGLLVNIVFDLILIPAYGIEGAAVAAPLGALAYLAVTYRYARRFARWHFPLDTCLRAAAGGAAAYLVAREAVPAAFGDLASVCLGLALGLAAYVIALLVLGERKAGPAVAAVR